MRNVEISDLGVGGEEICSLLNGYSNVSYLFLDMNQSEVGPMSTRHGDENRLSASL